MTSAEHETDEHIPYEDDENSSVRFEDLTVDDDIPIIERVVRFSRSSIALQRLVHVKMLAETAELSGALATQKVLVPSIQPLLQDVEGVIRQHVAAQLLPLALVCMINLSSTPTTPKHTVQELMDDPSITKQYDPAGYKIVATTVMDYLQAFLQDPELDVRRAAADSIAGLSLQMKPGDVSKYCLSLPLKLTLDTSKNNNTTAPSLKDDKQKQKRTEDEQRGEELRITAANLLAEMGGAASEHRCLQASAQIWVHDSVLPAILQMAQDSSFRIRRCAAQAMPRLLGACRVDMSVGQVLDQFDELSRDEIHRVRKAVGECLVDMSRAIVILADIDPEQRQSLFEKRRKILLPIAERLIQDAHKMVRQGMMQFLGPFMASFYPYLYSPLHTLLPRNTESDGSNHVGIVAQFFPHSSSMVSRLNSSQNVTQSAPTPVHARLEELTPIQISDVKKLQRALPQFIHAARLSAWSLEAVTTHREQHPPDKKDLKAVVDLLLDYFVALAAVQTGDENTDAEMRVYCAYSFPAVVLLLGPEHWEGAVRTCFHTLLNPRYPAMPSEDDEDDDNEPPLPVKRCLASSLHTVAHIVGSDIAVRDILGVVQGNFLRDTDDSVRLSTIRNFPAILKLVPTNQRRASFLSWSEVILSDDMLGGNKRSATNPIVLNWRQRDYLARSLPELVLLVEPPLIKENLWPIIKMLLEDPVNAVRDDTLWSIPILLKTYCPDSLLGTWTNVKDKAKKWSADMSLEVVSWLHENILKKESRIKVANFNDRQLYCRICAAVGLTLRFGEGDLESEGKDPASVLSANFKSFFFAEKRIEATENGPYMRLSPHEAKYLRNLLMEELLPQALRMKEDRISNVRITLMKCLQIMPLDIRSAPAVKIVLKDLEDEMETWTSFGAEEPSLVEQQQQFERETKEAAMGMNNGPVDVDAIPHNGEIAENSGGESGGSSGSGSDELEKTETTNTSPVAPKRALKRTEVEGENSDGEESNSSSSRAHYKKVTFEEGSIGMQLEPTANDTGCRVCAFLDGPDGTPSPARISGMIAVGDVIVKVNHTKVRSYDAAIELLKAGGRRKISFRPGRPEDTKWDDDDNTDTLEGSHKKEHNHHHHNSSSTNASGGGEDTDKKQKKVKKEKKEKKERKEKKREK